MHNNNQIQV